MCDAAVVATVYMLFGGVGTGKTTFARSLEQAGAVRLSLDEWTIAATGDSVHLDPNAERRVFDRLTQLWPQIVSRGVDVALDFGFWDRYRRDQVREIAASVQADVRLFWIDCSANEARQRCASRTTAGHDTYRIDDGGYDWIIANRTIDPLEHDEPHTKIDTTTHTD